ncbi:MAG: hypothetical protein MZV70_45545, partial [Desulfobacterales bacterium]|nr:hypothetical protein [Desulfobacterales bacterium]
MPFSYVLLRLTPRSTDNFLQHLRPARRVARPASRDRGGAAAGGRPGRRAARAAPRRGARRRRSRTPDVSDGGLAVALPCTFSGPEDMSRRASRWTPASASMRCCSGRARARVIVATSRPTRWPSATRAGDTAMIRRRAPWIDAPVARSRRSGPARSRAGSRRPSRMWSLRRLRPSRGREHHLPRALRAPAPRPGEHRHRRPADDGDDTSPTRGIGPRRGRVQRAHAASAAGPAAGHRPRSLLDGSGDSMLAQRPALLAPAPTAGPMAHRPQRQPGERRARSARELEGHGAIFQHHAQTAR